MISESLAQFVTELKYDSIAPALRSQAKLHLLDSIGVALASSGFDFAHKAFSGLAALGAGAHAVVGMRGKLPLRDAVLMNGLLVHGLEFDDTSIRGRIHPSAFCVPCALGVGEFAGASGKDALVAYIAGVECAVRIGMAAKGGFSPAGFNSVGVVGAFGSVLTAGKLLGLDREQLVMAQGLVYSTAAGNREFSADDSWTKRLEAGWPGVGAITAAMLAGRGYVGPRSAYEGKYGLFNTYLATPPGAGDLEAISSKLGECWEFERIMLKSLPSCFFNHPVINATLALVVKHDLRPRDIRSIRVWVPQAAIDTVCEPREKKIAPRDIAGAQFSVYFSAACAAARRRFTLEELGSSALNDAEIRALAARVDYEADPHSNFPAHYSGGVELTTLDGRVLGAREDINAGSVEKPLPASAVEEKFLANAQRVMPLQRAREIRDLLLEIDSMDSVASVTAKLGLSDHSSSA